MMIKGKAYINGVAIRKNNVVEIISPLNQKVIGNVPSLSREEINEAFESAHNSFPIWSQTDLQMRIKYINVFTKELRKSKHKIAEIMHQEIAKPLDQAINEIDRTIDYIEKTIKTYQQIRVKVKKIDNKTNTMFRVPLGVVLAISPFNYPINLSLSKIIPALIIGNTVVFKPATNGSLVGTYLGRIFNNINFPKGVLNIVTGKGQEIGDILVSNHLINMISFTGSVKTGQKIAKMHHFIPIVLELGGNDAAYVREDADIVLSARKIARGAFEFSGQRCTAIKRLIVNENIKDVFLEALIKEAKQIEPIPLINNEAANWVSKLLDDQTLKIVLGNQRNGNTFCNTIVETTINSAVWNEEAFGPILPIVYVKNDEQAIRIINASNYGLQNCLFTKNIEWAKKCALKIESGSVNINGVSSRGPDEFPFLGIKNSGFGTQGIEEALLSMSRYLNVVENE